MFVVIGWGNYFGFGLRHSFENRSICGDAIPQFIFRGHRLFLCVFALYNKKGDRTSIIMIM